MFSNLTQIEIILAVVAALAAVAASIIFFLGRRYDRFFAKRRDKRQKDLSTGQLKLR